MGLETLFPRSAIGEFRERMDVIPGTLLRITERTQKDDTVHVLCEWLKGDEVVGTMGFIFDSEDVHITSLAFTEEYQGQGYHTAIETRLAEWLPTLGLKRLTMLLYPDSEGRRRLERCGYHELSDGAFGTMLENDKGHQYIEWAKEGKPKETEPEWHRVLVEEGG